MAELTLVCRAERFNGSTWSGIDEVTPFTERHFGVFGFLGNVANYAAIPPIARRRGLPEDASPDTLTDFHAAGPTASQGSWLTLRELLDYDYDKRFENRRLLAADGGNATCPAGKGVQTTYRAFLGRVYFRHLAALEAAKAERIVFWFEEGERVALVAPTLAETLTVLEPQYSEETMKLRALVNASETQRLRTLSGAYLQRLRAVNPTG